MIDLIVPTIPGREESLERTLASFPDTNHIVVTGQPTCGLGWLEGIERSTADYLILCCDDIEAHPDCDLDACVETVERKQIPAPLIYRPNGTIESAGGDMGAPGCLLTDIRPDCDLVDFTPLPFVSRAQIEDIGMHSGHYMTDVYLSHKGRELGYETVLRHPFKLIHHHHMTGRRSPSGEDDRLYREAMQNGA